MFCGVWNLHGRQAPEDIADWVPLDPPHHIYIIGTCEAEASIAKSMVFPSKARWEQQVRDYLGQDYFLVGSQALSAIHLMVFIHRFLWRYCWDTWCGTVATGFANYCGNKGGTQVAFCLGHTRLLVINSHLAAHKNKMQERTHSLARILRETQAKHVVKGQDVLSSYDRIFLMGDLNIRLDAQRDEVDQWLEASDLTKCLEHDQLLRIMQNGGATAGEPNGAAGMWPHFQEAQIRFPPTYKYDVGTERYDTSSKRRVPAWTDRILWRKDDRIRSLSYDSVRKYRCSDHEPIFAQFEVIVDLKDWSGPEEKAKGSGGRSSTVCTVQ